MPQLFWVEEGDVLATDRDAPFTAVPEAHEEGGYSRFSCSAWTYDGDMLTGKNREGEVVEGLCDAAGVGKTEVLCLNGVLSRKRQGRGRGDGLRFGIKNFKEAFSCKNRGGNRAENSDDGYQGRECSLGSQC